MSITKIGKIVINVWNYYFSKWIYIFVHQTKCLTRYKMKLYLFCLFFSLKMQKSLMQTKVYNKFFFSVGKDTTHKPSEVMQQKTISLGYMLLGQLASIDTFYSMQRPEGIVFMRFFSLLSCLFVISTMLIAKSRIKKKKIKLSV